MPSAGSRTAGDVAGVIRQEVPACCGATEDLTIDHLNGQGGGHRTDLFNGRRTGGWHFYRWLAANNFPPGYQVLCRACNNSKFQGERCRLDHGIAA